MAFRVPGLRRTPGDPQEQPQARMKMDRPGRELRLPGRAGAGLEQAILSAAAAALAWLPAQALGLREGFWAAITAIAVAQSEFNAASSTARDQFFGALVGGMVAVLFALACGTHLWSYTLAVAIAILVCWLVNIASAARLAGITATIILLVPHAGTPQQMLISRVAEVAWGILMAIAIVWLANKAAASGKPKSD